MLRRRPPEARRESCWLRSDSTQVVPPVDARAINSRRHRTPPSHGCVAGCARHGHCL